jgi:hypothetical protein
MEILLDDAAHEERRDSGVERVATAREDLESGRGRQRISAETAALGPMAGGRWTPSAVILRKSAGTSAMDVAVRGQDRSIPIILNLLTSMPPGLHVLFPNGKEVHPTLLPCSSTVYSCAVRPMLEVMACTCTEKRCMEMSQTQ